MAFPALADDAAQSLGMRFGPTPQVSVDLIRPFSPCATVVTGQVGYKLVAVGRKRRAIVLNPSTAAAKNLRGRCWSRNSAPQASSSRTRLPASSPCSMAPSMKPRQPLAQSALAKITRPRDCCNSRRYRDHMPCRSVHQVPFEY